VKRLVAAPGLESGVALAIAQARGLADAGERVLAAIGEALGLRAGIMWRVRDSDGRLVVAAEWVADERARVLTEHSRRRKFSRGEGLPGQVLADGHAVWLPDIAHDDRYTRAAAAREAGLRASIGVPLVARGETVGALELLLGEIVPLDPELELVLEGLGGQLGQLLERVEADEAIAASEARKAAILNAAPDAIVTTDGTGRILEANHGFERLFGWPADEAVGKRIADVLATPAADGPDAAEARRYLATGEPGVLGRPLELEGVRRDGSRLPIELTVTRVELPGRPLFTAFLRDVSASRAVAEEHARLLAAEQAARESAELAWRRLRLVSDVSEILAVSLDYQSTFARLASRVVRDAADICLIDVAEPDGIVRVAARHRDPALQPLVDGLQPPAEHGPHPAAEVMESALSQFSPEMSPEFLRRTTRDEEHYRLVRALGFQSFITVPLIVHSRILGTLTLVSTNPERRYTREDVAVAEELARRAAVRIDNARLFRDRQRVAHVLQQGLLPHSLPSIPHLKLAARYFPAGEIAEAGGDFYDVFATADGCWGIAIGDVSGKGPEAAAVMGLTRYTLRALARANRRPRLLLRALNEELLGHDLGGRFVTVAYVRVRSGGPDGLNLTVCLAGHPSGLRTTTAGEVIPVGRPGTLLGMVQPVQLREQQLRLAPGETLLLHTDGLADIGGSLAPLREEELHAFLADHRGTSPEQIAAALDVLIAQRHDGSPGRDDIAFVVLRASAEP
jgi:PAS domain S-box-containing protein